MDPNHSVNDGGQSVHTVADIITSPFTFRQITGLHLCEQANEHARLILVASIHEDQDQEILDQATREERIVISTQGSSTTTTIFDGLITNVSIEVMRDVKQVTIEAVSRSILLDLQKKNRSFQKNGQAYAALYRTIISSYTNAQVMDYASEGSAQSGLLVQYEESDWQFLKRLASHVHAPLISASSMSGVRLYVGLPPATKVQQLDEHNYVVNKTFSATQQQSEAKTYTVTSAKYLSLGSVVKFQQQTVYVGGIEAKLTQGILQYTYQLKEKAGFYLQSIPLLSLTGASLSGTITAIQKDQVQISLKIDQGAGSGAMWFPYATVYSSPDGSGWYCMPEIGDDARLYFPNHEAKNAFVISSVDKDSADAQKRSDPNIKSISTKYGKQLVFKPNAVEISGNGKWMMTLTDDGGIEMNSSKKIMLTAQEDIEIQGQAKISIEGQEGIEFVQGGTKLNIADQVAMQGGRVNIE
jgi:hypothetical protein